MKKFRVLYIYTNKKVSRFTNGSLLEQGVKSDSLLEEFSSSSLMPPPPIPVRQSVPSEPKLSSVYSLDIHSEALWAVQGCENGSINLTTVRHEEGKCHHVLRKHTAPVSVLMITPDETGVISGSWDKSVLEWDLNTGAVVRSYDGHSSQLSSAEFQPMYTPYVPNELEESSLLWNSKNSNIMLTTSIDGQCLLWDRREPTEAAKRLTIPERTPPWCLSVSNKKKRGFCLCQSKKLVYRLAGVQMVLKSIWVEEMVQ
jgi:transcriptional activator SPT8